MGIALGVGLAADYNRRAFAKTSLNFTRNDLDCLYRLAEQYHLLAAGVPEKFDHGIPFVFVSPGNFEPDTLVQ